MHSSASDYLGPRLRWCFEFVVAGGPREPCCHVAKDLRPEVVPGPRGRGSHEPLSASASVLPCLVSLHPSHFAPRLGRDRSARHGGSLLAAVGFAPAAGARPPSGAVARPSRCPRGVRGLPGRSVARAEQGGLCGAGLGRSEGSGCEVERQASGTTDWRSHLTARTLTGLVGGIAIVRYELKSALGW